MKRRALIGAPFSLPAKYPESVGLIKIWINIARLIKYAEIMNLLIRHIWRIE